MLGLGWNFIPTPPVTLPLLTFTQSVNRFLRSLCLQHVFDPLGLHLSIPSPFRIKSSFTPETDENALIVYSTIAKRRSRSAYNNLVSSNSLRARKNIPRSLSLHLSNLLKDPSITIGETDKNCGIAVAPATLDSQYALGHLNDTTSYLPVTEKHANALITRFCSSLKKWCLLEYGDDFETYSTCKFLLEVTPVSSRFPKFKNLWKVHKPTLATRPLCCAMGYVTYNASKFIHHKLLPIMKAMQPHVAKDSRSVVAYLDSHPLPNSTVLCSYDIAALYPSIPTEAALTSIAQVLASPQFANLYPPDKIASLIALVRLVLTHNVVRYRKNLWLQTKGVAMGTPGAVVIANIFLFSIESNLVQRYRELGTLLIFFRFLDDILAAFTSKESACNFFLEYNTLHPDISASGTLGTSVNWLDATFSKMMRFNRTGLLDVQVYQKPINNYLYLPYCSFHSKSARCSFIKGELIRYIRLSSSKSDYLKVRQLFANRLLARGFPFSVIQTAASQVNYSTRLSYLDATVLRPVDYKPSLIFPLIPDSAWRPLKDAISADWHLIDHLPSFNNVTPRIVNTNHKSLGDLVNIAYASRYK